MFRWGREIAKSQAVSNVKNPQSLFMQWVRSRARGKCQFLTNAIFLFMFEFLLEYIENCILKYLRRSIKIMIYYTKVCLHISIITLWRIFTEPFFTIDKHGILYEALKPFKITTAVTNRYTNKVCQITCNILVKLWFHVYNRYKLICILICTFLIIIEWIRIFKY